jgi:hypothetical protein
MNQEERDEPIPYQDHFPAKDDCQDKCDFVDRMSPNPKGLEVNPIFSFEQLERSRRRRCPFWDEDKCFKQLGTVHHKVQQC